MFILHEIVWFIIADLLSLSYFNIFVTWLMIFNNIRKIDRFLVFFSNCHKYQMYIK